LLAFISGFKTASQKGKEGMGHPGANCKVVILEQPKRERWRHLEANLEVKNCGNPPCQEGIGKKPGKRKVSNSQIE